MKRIIVTQLNKKFKINSREHRSVLARFVGWVHRHPIKTIQVVKDISFEAEAGEIVGVIGLNGSGKSTLLRLIAGIYRADSGGIVTEGSLNYLSGFGQGLQPLLTMRENICLMGAMMGLSRQEIRGRFDEIVDFAGLKDFVDTKVFQFSSGMSSRLNFSIVLFCLHHKNPDILLLDEVLGGAGDVDFQNKTVKKIEELIHVGATVVLVSHELEVIKKYSHRVIWLDKGCIVRIGGPAEVIAEYLAYNGNGMAV